MDSLKKMVVAFFLKTYVHSNFFRVDERSEGSHIGLEVFFLLVMYFSWYFSR